MSLETVDVHTTTNWPTSFQVTTVPTNAHQTIDPAYRYGLLITSPYEPSPGASMQVYDIAATFTLTELRD